MEQNLLQHQNVTSVPDKTKYPADASRLPSPYRQTILRRGLILLSVPCLVGVLTFALLDQLWSETKTSADNARRTTQTAEALNNAITDWNGASMQYMQMLVSEEGAPDAMISRYQQKLVFDLMRAEELAGKRDADTSSIIRQFKILYVREQQAMVNIRNLHSASVAVVTSQDTHPETINKVRTTVAQAFDEFSQVKQRERELFIEYLNRVQQLRQDQNSTLWKFQSVLLAAFLGNVALTIILAGVFTREIAQKLHTVNESAQEYLRKQFEIKRLSSRDEFAYLQTILRDSFEHIFSAADERKVLLAMIAHDMRSPLMSAKSYLYLMEELDLDFGDEAVDKLMQIYDRLDTVLAKVELILSSEKASPFQEPSDEPLLGAPPELSAFIKTKPNRTLSQRFMQPRLIHQFLFLAIFPLFVQIFCFGFIGMQVRNISSSTQKANHCSDLIVAINLSALNLLSAVSEQAKYLLVNDQAAASKAKQFFQYAGNESQRLVTLAHGDQLAEDYAQPFADEIQMIAERSSRSRYSKSILPIMNWLVGIGNFHNLSGEARSARHREVRWLEANSMALERAQRQTQRVSDEVSHFIAISIAAYLLSDIALLSFLLLEINRRVKVLYQQAGAIGKTDYARISALDKRGDELAIVSGSLSDAHSKLMEASAKRTTILRTLSKEIHDPLYAALIAEREFGTLSRDKLDEKGSDYLSRSQLSVAQVLELIRDLVAVEQLNDAQVELVRSSFNVREWVEQAKISVEGLAKEKDIAIAASADDGDIWADEAQLKRVLVNLASNAVKFSPRGTRVVIAATRRGKNLLVEVTDQGPGIAQDELAKVFERSFRSASARETVDGHGLGLAIAKMITEAHRGTIGVDSKAGSGAKFWFEIPCGSNS